MLTPTKFFTRAISCSLDGNGLQLEKATDIGDQLADTYEQCAEDQTGYGVSDVFRGGHYFALLVGGLTFQNFRSVVVGFVAYPSATLQFVRLVQIAFDFSQHFGRWWTPCAHEFDHYRAAIAL